MPNTQHRVAIVDDDESVREAIKQLMRAMGFAAEAFSSGEEFLRWTDLNHADCLITDMHMPNMSGLDLHESLAVQGTAIPAIMITAYPSETVRERALEAGFLCYLTKPFDEEDLLTCIRSALERGEAPQSAS